jgi:hypothetical protein
VEERQFAQSKLHREESFRNKQSSFKEVLSPPTQFYDNANKFRDNVANGYLQYVSSSKDRQ